MKQVQFLAAAKQLIIAAIFLPACCITSLTAQTVYYVDVAKANNTGAGTSWATAKKDLQNAIHIAVSGDRIWVKAGIYLPTEDPSGSTNPADPRDKTFFLKDGVKVYGGFNGTETALAQRNVAANVTKLSGDIGIANKFSDDCYHVVVAAVAASITPACTLDGFTIEGGYADNNTFLTVNTLSLQRNVGGGIYTRYGANTIANNTITGNFAGAGGGGIATIGGPGALIGSSNNITNNIITGNTGNNGAGIYAVLCTDTILNNSITGQLATNGAGIYINSGKYIISHNTFDNNSAAIGGGLYVFNGAFSALIANSIINNSSGISGGGLYLRGSTTSCINNLFNGNSSKNGGALYAADDNDDVFTNNTFHANNAAASGSALYSNGCINLRVRNNIFWGNKINADSTVPGADYFEGATPGNTFTNNLMQLAETNYSTSGSGAYDLGTGASGNVFAKDPGFVNPQDPDGPDNIIRTADDGLRLQAGSPAINGGMLAITSPVTDIIDAIRGVAPFDVGAYEWFTCQGSNILYVDAGASISGSGYSWATAFKTLDEALFVAQNCPVVTTINVAAGIYKPTQKPYENGITITTTDARDVCFYLRDSLKLFGGFPSGGGTRDVLVNITTLSGDIGVVNDVADNAYHVVVIASAASIMPTATLDGFMISGGNADNNTPLAVKMLSLARNIGGGIYARYGNNTIVNNTITGNSASGGGGIATIGGASAFIGTTNVITNNIIKGNSATNGGGIYMSLCTNTLVNNNITNNKAANNGGGSFINGGAYNIRRTSISSNMAGNFGGALHIINSTDTLSANTITGNSSVTGGGGLYSSGSTTTCINSVLTQNTSASGGGAFVASDYNDVYINNTIQANSASLNGGGLYTNGCLHFQLQNNIFWGNKKGTDATVQGSDYFEAGIPGNTFTTNLLQLAGSAYSFSGSGSYDLGLLASGNIYATDPNFVNPADPDGPDNIDRTADDGLRISCGSTATEAGSGNTVKVDILNNTRNGSRDMGAYEANGTTAINTLPTAATSVSLVQTPGVLDYTSCLDEVVKIDGSNPYTILGNTTAKVWIESSQPAVFVKRHYEITHACTGTGRVTLYFTQPEFDNFNSVVLVKLPVSTADASGKASLRIHQISGTSNDGSGLPPSYSGASTIIDPADTAIVWNSLASRWEVSFDVTGCGGFFIESSQTVLPLHWLSITGSLNEKDQPLISWYVAENNVANYTIEKSIDGKHFGGVTNINSKGNGDHYYSFTDVISLQATAYFRIRQTSIDGTFDYSSIVSLYPKNATINTYPNPVKDVITVNAGNALSGTTAVLTDINGKVLQQVVISHSKFTFNMSRYTSGVYILKIGNRIFQKIIKE